VKALTGAGKAKLKKLQQKNQTVKGESDTYFKKNVVINGSGGGNRRRLGGEGEDQTEEPPDHYGNGGEFRGDKKANLFGQSRRQGETDVTGARRPERGHEHRPTETTTIPH